MPTVDEIVKRMDYPQRAEPRWFMGLDQKIHFDFSFDLLNCEKVKWFCTSTKRAYGYAEFTPFNKGFLFKIRRYFNGYYKVFYGTKEMCYSTTIQECINFIKKQSNGKSKSHP